MPESLPECEVLVDSLSSLETPSTQQRFDLAEAHFTLADWIPNGQGSLP